MQSEIEKLELLVMEHEQTIETYSTLLQDQQTQIDTLKARLELIEQKLSKYDDVGAEVVQNEKPPHY